MKVTKVVRSHEVEELTREGWHLVFHIDTAQRVAHHREAFPGSYNPHVPPEGKTVVGAITDPLFALEKDQEILTREAELAGRIGNAEVKFREMRDEAAKLTKTLNDTQSELKIAQHSCAIAHDEIEQLRAKNKQAGELYRKLEGDMARVRNEIGEARWREIFK